MKINYYFSVTLFSAFFLCSARTAAIDTSDTRLMSQPAVSAEHIAFIYAEDVWVASLDGSNPRRLTVDEGIESDPHFSPDGRLIAFSAQYDGNTDVFVVQIPQPSTGCNDAEPMWIGDNVYFISDRNGEFNLYSYNTPLREIKQLTFSDDFPILNATNGNGTIIFEQAGYLHIYDLTASNSRKLTVGIAADLLEMRERFVEGSDYIRSSDISPTGARAVFDFRGDIITLPAEKGDPRNLTLTTNAHEKYPAWS